MSVVLDSNLWISAFIFRGRPLEMGLDRLVDIAVSQSIIDETLRVMNDKFHAKPIVLESALFIMTTSARMVEPVIQLKAVRDDPNDDHVVSCAIAPKPLSPETGFSCCATTRASSASRSNRLRSTTLACASAMARSMP